MAKDGYKNRSFISEPAPLELDSDSDFNPGKYSDPEKKEKKKRKRKSLPKKPRTSASSNKRSRSEYEKYNRDPRPEKRPKHPVYNPLSEFFDVTSEYEAEAEDDDDMDVDGEDDDDDKPATPKALTSASPRAKPPDSDDSATEDEDILFSQTSSKFVADDDSATEEEDEEYGMTTKRKTVDEDSATEDDEEEYNMIVEEGLKPRPGFPLPPGKQPSGSLVLDTCNDIKVPASINTHLREYQRDGVRFFWNQYNQSMGGLLGDDMGLGKTIQVISFLSAIMKKTGTGIDKGRRHKHVSRLQDQSEWRDHRKLPPPNATWPTALIIAPSTVARNWERELATWGYFEVGMYVGDPEERKNVIEDFKKGRLDVVVTSFELARRDIDILESLAWSCIFVDEVHRVKNEKAKITTAYMRFECQIRFGLTGTAIQNNYNELWTILNWTSPGKLGNANQWELTVTRPLALGQSKSANESERVKSIEVRNRLVNKLLPRFFLRRDKNLIKDQLPQKMDQVVFCPLTPKQIEVYKRVLACHEVQAMIHKDDPCSCGSRQKSSACCRSVERGWLFKYLSVLIKLSNHLALLLPSSEDTLAQMERNREYASMAFPEGDAPTYGVAHLQPEYCGKWLCLEKLLFDWKKDLTNKVLIFTKSVKMLSMLDYYLRMKHFGTVKLDGSVPQRARMGIIDQFHADPNIFVFLISTLAGGTGLNLTGANKVVIFDPNWNPAHDLQAMDRAFRIGQTRNVEVFRLLGAGSLEELIYDCQIYKQQQMEIGYKGSIQTPYFDGVRGRKILKPGELFGIQNIFRLREGTLLTKMAIEQASIAEFTWALGNMNGKVKREEDSNGAAAKIDNDDFSGLDQLLLEPPAAKPEKSSETDSLSGTGVKYTHRNDELLKPSAFQEQRAMQDVQKAKRARKSAGSDPNSPQWPPRRPSRKKKPDAEELTRSRTQALVIAGFVPNPSSEELAKFAKWFNEASPEEQTEVIAVLDRLSL